MSKPVKIILACAMCLALGFGVIALIELLGS
jgi:hypothetical protein